MVIPDFPLPGVRHCRVSVVGHDSFAHELAAALHVATGRRVCVHSAPPRGADVVFVATADAGTAVGSLRTAWPHGAVGVVRATLPDPAGAGAGLRSVLQFAQERAPYARLVGALHLVSVDHLVLASLGTLATDVPVVSDDDEAADLVAALVDGVPGLSAVRVGAARAAAGIEGLSGVVRAVESHRGHPVGVRLGADTLRFVDPGVS